MNGSEATRGLARRGLLVVIGVAFFSVLLHAGVLGLCKEIMASVASIRASRWGGTASHIIISDIPSNALSLEIVLLTVVLALQLAVVTMGYVLGRKHRVLWYCIVIWLALAPLVVAAADRLMPTPFPRPPDVCLVYGGVWPYGGEVRFGDTGAFTAWASLAAVGPWLVLLYRMMEGRWPRISLRALAALVGLTGLLVLWSGSFLAAYSEAEGLHWVSQRADIPGAQSR